MTGEVPALPADWPHRDSSRFVQAANLRWHVQCLGAGPVVLLLHGTGAGTHSWAGLATLLAQHFTVVMPDLPGQGFTELAPPAQCSLAGMAKAVAALLRELDLSPSLIVGHSAGAAVGASLCLRGSCAPAALVSINGAMLPFGRAAAPVFSRAARFLSELPVFPQLIALHAVPRKPVLRMLRQTGSTLPPESVAWYRQLVGMPRHVAGTLRMMANWDLPQLEQNLHRLEPELYLLVCDRDSVVSPEQGDELAQRLPRARLTHIPDLGHLGHEEDPALFHDMLLEIARALHI
jgi:magnesium chelatase accessory protein